MLTEMEMRESTVPTPKSTDELTVYIASLVNREHDYGTCVYAMSMAAVAAFNYVAREQVRSRSNLHWNLPLHERADGRGLAAGWPVMRLDEYTKDEFRAVAMALCPHWSDEEFEQKWAEFIVIKSARADCDGEA